MKNIILFFFSVLTSFAVMGQVQVPQPSPAATHEQVVGLTNVTLNYSRPGMRDRTIFGELVPYNEKWRTGANNNTTISFDTQISIAGNEIPAGTYAIYTIPKQKKWEVIFYKDSNNWGLPETWDESKIALTATAEAHQLPLDIETFTISIDDLANDSANLYFIWENTIAILPFQVPTEKIAMASIDRVMKNNPSAADFVAAATYYHDEEKDIEKAYQWIQKAVEMEIPAYWVLRRKSLIEADLGKEEEAIATARKSLAAAEKAGNKDYVKMNRDSLKEWGVD